MIILSTTTDVLHLVTSTIAALDVHASYLDNASGTVTSGRNNTSISSAMTSPIVLPPSSGVQRNVKSLFVHNKDATLSNTVTVQHNNGGAGAVQLHSTTLAPGQTLQYTDEEGFSVSASAFTMQMRTFTTTQSYIPPPNLLFTIFEAVGGGGAGGAAIGNWFIGGGGGGGGYSRKLLSAAQIGSSLPITIGAGGAPGDLSSTFSGGPGGDTSVGAFCIAKGGLGGIFCQNASQLGGGGAGGVPGTGDVVAGGTAGVGGSYGPATGTGTGGAPGGGNPLGGGGLGVAQSGLGGAGQNYGGGGAGAGTTGSSWVAGGAGSAGAVIATEFIGSSLIAPPTNSGTGNLVFLGSVNAANSPTISFTGIDGTYDEYVVIGSGISIAAFAAGAVDLGFYVSQNNGATWDNTSTYYWTARQENTGSASGNQGNSVGTFGGPTISLLSGGPGIPPNPENHAFELHLHKPASALYKEFDYRSGGVVGNPATAVYFVVQTGAGQYRQTAPYNAIRFAFFGASNPNILTGTFSLYGVAKVPPIGSASQAGAKVYLGRVVANNNTLDWVFAPGDPYDGYEFELINIIPASNAGLIAKYQVDNVWQTANGYLSMVSGGYTLGFGGAGSYNDGAPFSYDRGIWLTGSGANGNPINAATAGYGYSGTAIIHSPQNTTRLKHLTHQGGYFSSTIYYSTAQGGGFWPANFHAVQGVRFVGSSAGADVNIATGEMRVYGIRSVDGAGAPAAFAVGGQLTYSSATALSFGPKNGGYTIINGAALPIPSGGIVGLNNTNVYVNGVAGQNLAGNTTYLVCEFNNAGVVTADFRSGATHATSSTPGNVGTEILTGDDTRSLIGMIRTNASAQFVNSKTQRFIRSWFNTSGVETANVFTADRTLTTGPTFAEINSEIRNEFLLWAGERAEARFAGTVEVNSSTYAIFTAIGFDGVTAEPNKVAYIPPSAAYYTPAAVTAYRDNLSEGYHYATLLGAISTGAVATGLWGGSPTTYGVCSLSVSVRSGGGT